MAVALSSPYEYLPGSTGVLLPLHQARLVREDGSYVDSFGEPGELILSSPNQAAGYLGDDESTALTFRHGWLRTGDVALFRPGEKGDSHLFIVDRLKDMIKVKVYFCNYLKHIKPRPNIPNINRASRLRQSLLKIASVNTRSLLTLLSLVYLMESTASGLKPLLYPSSALRPMTSRTCYLMSWMSMYKAT